MTHGGGIDEDDKLLILLRALSKKYDSLKEVYFTKIPAPNMNYVWHGYFTCR